MRVPSKVGTARWLALAAGGCCVCGSALGQTNVNWQAPVTGPWGQASNWSPAQVPNNSGSSLFNAAIQVTGAPYEVTLDSNFTVSGLTLGPATPSSDPTLNLNARALTVRAAYTQTGARLLGVGARDQNTITIAGATTLSGAVLEHTRITTRGNLQLLGSDNDICDTDMDHRGSAASWSGTGNILIDGAGRFTNGFASTFTILNSQNITTDATGRFVNNGRLVKQTGAGTTFINLTGGAFTNAGTVEVQSGILRVAGIDSATFSGGVLNTGVWRVLSGRTLQLDGAAITTSNADVTLSGAGATFTAIDGLTTIGATGKFTVQNGRNFTTAGAFTNNGQLTLGAGTNFTVNGGLSNFAGGTLTGGVYSVNAGSVLTFNGAAIATLNAKLTLDGAGSQVRSETAADALSGLNRVQSAGDFTVSGGRSFTAASFTVDAGGKVAAGAGSTISLGALSNFAGGTLTGGSFSARGGQIRFNGAGGDVTTLDADVALDGAAARLADQTGASHLSALATIAAGRTLAITGGQQFATSATLALTGDAALTVGAASRVDAAGLAFGSTARVTVAGTVQFPGAAFTSVPAGLILQPGGRVLNGTTNAFDALNTIQGNAQYSLGAGQSQTLLGNLTTQASGNLTIGERGSTSVATLNIPGNYTQNGSTQLNNGVLNITGAYQLNGATTGSGSINAGSVVIGPGGVLGPGNSPGRVDITGDASVLEGSSFQLEIGGPDSVNGRGVVSDFLDFRGGLVFGEQAGGFAAGTLQYSFINAFEPEIGDRFVLVHVEGLLVGTFALVAPLNTGIQASAAWEGQDLVLTVTALPTPGAAGLLAMAGLAAARRRR